ncbi:MAG: K(+)-stimulated pyrophosphate-energized sodium pump [Syntrophaceae bacterium]|nr:MAG: K(+)-stimulated pyrophosphate-energized sodium pump [Syntrophaceae bacterium]
MFKTKRSIWTFLLSSLMFLLMAGTAFAGEANIKLPDLTQITFLGGSLTGMTILNVGLIICLIGIAFGILQYVQTKNLPAHKAMLDVSQTIWETCKTYLFQQGKFLIALWVLIAVCMIYYFGFLEHMPVSSVIIILIASIIGILGSYVVAWFGIRINTVANSRAAFSSLSGDPLNIVNICLRSGMSVGLLLVSIELFFMIIILAYIPTNLAGACFIGFAIGESLGASVLRICGGIFTKIADIGSDLMKIVFHLPEDDPKNPGVIADCTGDNAGDSVGPTADGFETYGVTGVALIVFLALALASTPEMGGRLIIWIFAMRILMILTSLVSYFINDGISKAAFAGKKEFNFEHPLTNLVWITSIVSIIITFVASYFLLGDLADAKYAGLWWALAIIISCGTIAGALIPEFTKIFTSTSSRHCEEVVNASRQGGASLNILSGLVAGNFSAFWLGMVILALMFVAYIVSTHAAIMAIMPAAFSFAAPVFAFGLVAFGFLGMGPVTIAVDSFGPVSDNAQSIYELSLIESRPDAKDVVKKHYGIAPDFALAKHFLESADGAGNTFKATAKPVLIGTAVVGATTMVFATIILLEGVYGQVVSRLSLVQPEIILGLLAGGSVIYWFTGASIQAVVTGAYQAVVFIKKNIKLDKKEASIEDSKEVVKICTQYAQKGMINIFIVIFFMTLALSFFNPYFFIGYLIGIAFFGLFQAIFMANAGGCWDNGKKIVEVDLKQKNTPLHEAAVVGDTVGDPFKDTSSVSLNPIIKFTTLFGLLAVEIAVTMANKNLKLGLAIVFLLIALVFVYRSFYSMRISSEKLGD